MKINEEEAKIIIYALYSHISDISEHFIEIEEDDSEEEKIEAIERVIYEIQEDLALQDKMSYLPTHHISENEAEIIYPALKEYYEQKETGLDVMDDTPNTFPTTSPEVLEAHKEEIETIKEQKDCAKKQIKIMAKLIKNLKKNFPSETQ